MSIALAPTAQPPEQHARWCSGGCPRWFGLGAPTCVPWPCRCAETKANRPEWARDSCWWIKKTTGRAVSRCPCWGRERVDGLPGSCCAHHSANPRYAVHVPATLDDIDVAPYLDLADRERPARVDAALYDWSGVDPEEEFRPYERMWTREESTCPCVTPWDGDKRATGWHCAACHEHFKSYAVGEVHRRRWTEPCRPPHTIVDVDTGAPLMYQGADGVWGPLYPTAD